MGNKLGINVTWIVFKTLHDFCFIQKFNIAARANFSDLFKFKKDFLLQNCMCDGYPPWYIWTKSFMFFFANQKSRMASIARQVHILEPDGKMKKIACFRRWPPPQEKLTLDPMGKLFKNYSDLKPLYHLKANLAGMWLGCSFTKCIFIMSIQDDCHTKAWFYHTFRTIWEHIFFLFFSRKQLIWLNPNFHRWMVPYRSNLT